MIKVWCEKCYDRAVFRKLGEQRGRVPPLRMRRSCQGGEDRDQNEKGCSRERELRAQNSTDVLRVMYINPTKG